MSLRVSLIVALLATVSGWAQKTLVTGRVMDAETSEALPYVNVFFKDSKIGTTTDEHGNYRIETYYATDSLVASFVGYNRLAKRVRKDQSQVIDFALRVAGVDLEVVTVVADKKAKDPAVEVMKKVVKNKPANNREKLSAYEYAVYNKLEFDMNNVTEGFTDRKVLKPFEFVFENIDSTSEDKAFLPIFLTESVSRFYYRKQPRSSMEVIEATKVAGVKNESVSQFMGDMYQGTNVYDNFIEAFDKSFVSPLSDFGSLSYHYYLMDSARIDGRKCYKIAFLPRRKGELVFEGEMWINDTTYAVKQIAATITADANINWVNAFSVYHEYDQVENEVWMLTMEKVVADFNVSEKTIGFYGRKTTYYSDFVINKPQPDNFYSRLNNIEVTEGAMAHDDSFWQTQRPEKLSENESRVYEMVDTMVQIPAFRTYVDLITLFVNGYYEMRYIDLGPYFTAFSFNQIEGPRFRLGGRTNSDFSNRIELSAYLAYGTLDQQFKYQGATRLFLSEKPRQILSLSTRRDLEQLGSSSNAWRTDNILSSVFRRTPNNQLNAFEEYKASYQVEFFPGLSATAGFNRRDIWSVGTIAFEKPATNGTLQPLERLSTTELNLSARLAINEKFISGNLDRISLGTNWPVLQANATAGLGGWLGGEYNYQRLTIVLQDKITFNPIGWSEFTAEVGRVWGTVPYPFLMMYPGNQTYFYDDYAFNLMNFYEFVSDRWATLFWTHHFNGLVLNRIPVMRKLRFREVATVRAAAGELAANHGSELNFPTTLHKLRTPYVEGGVGIENILKIFRVDALWRFTYLNHPDIVPFGVRLTFQFDF